MENHNWSQPANKFTGSPQQIVQNPNAPFINSLVSGTAFAVVNGQVVHISEQVAYATAYHNVLATPSGNNPDIHPSEPNHIWAEAGNYAAKDNPQVFFTDTNGGNDPRTSYPLASHYAPLQQFFIDLANNNIPDYTRITPNQYNDMHTALAAGYKGLTADPAKILQGGDFLSQVVPVIMASTAYQDHGVIVIWFDESEGTGASGELEDDFNHTIPEIIISSRTHKNVNGIPYASPLNYTHSSDLRTWQNVFHVVPYLRDAANAIDLSDLFQSGTIPKKP